MKMLKLLILILAVAGIGTSYAQETPKKSAEERAKLHTERMTKELKLSKDQIAAVTKLNLTIASKKDEIRANTALTKEQKQDALKKLDDSRMGRLESILTEDQFKKVKEHHEKMLERKQEAADERKEIRDKNKTDDKELEEL